MKLLNCMVLLFFTALLLTQAHAGGGGVVNTGGGHGVYENKNAYLLDFYNIDAHATISIPTCDKSDLPVHKSQLMKKGFDSELVHALTCTLKKYYEIDPVFTQLIYKGILFHEWNFSDNDLILTNHNSPYRTNNNIVQLASRQSRIVYVDSKHWDKLNISNKVGLVFHEIFSSLTQPSVHPERVRQTLALIFMKTNPQEIKSLLTAEFPSTAQFFETRSNISYSQPVTPLDQGRKSDVLQKLIHLPDNRFLLSTAYILFTLEEDELLLAPFLDFGITLDNRYVRFRQFYFYPGSTFSYLDSPCDTSAREIGLKDSDQLNEITVQYRRFVIFPTLEDDTASLNPFITWSTNENIRRDIYQFTASPRNGNFASCTAEQKQSVLQLVDYLSNFKLL